MARFCVRGSDLFGLDNGSLRYPYEDLDSTTLQIIIRNLGRCFSPCELRGFGYISDEIRTSRFLINTINHLASKPDRSASKALESLLADDSIDRWHACLSQARDSQRIIRRDAEYCHPTLQHACQALQGGPPANPGDLAALTVDRIRNIAAEIRTRNNNEWRLFWNEVSHGKPGEPKVENSCRDALLALLKPHLPLSGERSARRPACEPKPIRHRDLGQRIPGAHRGKKEHGPGTLERRSKSTDRKVRRRSRQWRLRGLRCLLVRFGQTTATERWKASEFPRDAGGALEGVAGGEGGAEDFDLRH